MVIPNLRITALAIGLLALLGGLGLLAERFRPRPAPTVTVREDTELRRQLVALTQSNNTLVAEVNANRSRDERQNQALYETQQKLAHVNTTTRETIYRGDTEALARLLAAQGKSLPPVVNITTPPQSPGTPSPGGGAGSLAGPGPAPVIVNVPEMRPSAPLPSAPLPPVEIVVRDTRTEDRSTETSTAKSNTTTEVKTTESSNTKTEEKTETTQSVQSDEKIKTEKTVEVKPASSSEGGRLGVGITGSAQPFLSYDVAQLPLFGLGRLNTGLYATGKVDGSEIDGGPQANFQKRRIFGMVGYGLRRQQVDIGIGFKF